MSLLQDECVPHAMTIFANRILNHHMLLIHEHPHRICEIEFYIKSHEHPDNYVHGHIDQTKSGTWYFHRYNNGTYKNGTFKGLDIVLNAGHVGVYAAVLIRNIYDLEHRKFIEGPCKVVDHILALYGVDSIQTLTQGASLNIYVNERKLVLVEGNPEKIEPLRYGPRIGLSDKYPEYKNKHYRYVCVPVKKGVKTLMPVT